MYQLEKAAGDTSKSIYDRNRAVYGLLRYGVKIKAEVGELSAVTRVVKVVGFVASDPDFYDQPEVINGASELLGAVFGEKGQHARSAVGVAVLPRNAPVEVEVIVEVG